MVNQINKYALKTKCAHIYNIFILLSYSCLFGIGILYLRILNKEKTINLKEYYDKIKNFLLETNIYESGLNITIFILLFIIYILSVIRLSQYFKFHVIKRHLSLVGNINYFGKYQQWFYTIFYKIYIINFIRIFLGKIEKLYDKYYYKYQTKAELLNYDQLSVKEQIEYEYKPPVDPFRFIFKYKLNIIITFILMKGHYILLLILLIWDIWYNNFQLTKIFYVLPWIFLYDIYLRISKFVEGVYLPYDQLINTLIYATYLERNNKYLYIDGDHFELETFRHIYKTYIKQDFIIDYKTI